MSRVRVYMATSLDGYVAGPDDDLSWLPTEAPPEVEGAVGFEAFMADVGAMLMGRRTYDVVQGFGGQWPYGDTPVLVATHRDLESKVSTVRAVSGSVDELIDAALEAAGSKDVYVDGGGLVHAALEANRIDELIISVAPIVLGAGVRLFGELVQPRALKFEQPVAYGSMVQLRATVVRT